MKRGITNLAIELGVLVEGVVELLGALLQPEGEGGFGTCGPWPIFEVPLLKQRPQVVR